MNMKKKLTKKLAIVMASSLITLSGSGQAALLNLSSVPLYLGGVVDPNVMFTLDDSGSMHWEYMPDDNWTWFVYPRPNNVYGSSNYTNYVPLFSSSHSYSVRVRSPDINKSYYNPEVRYLPWSYANGTSYPDADPSCAYHNPYKPDLDNDGRTNEVGDDCRDLTHNNKQSALWDTYDGNGSDFPSGVTFGEYGKTKTFWPAVYYRYDGSGDKWDKDNYNEIKISSSTSSYTGSSKRTDCASAPTCTYAEEIQNFANWYTYYRSRILAARAGIGRAFAQQSSSMRVGFATLNKSSDRIDGFRSNGSLVKGVRKFEGTDRTAWFDQLYGYSIPTYGTPLRRAQDNVGKYFEWSDDKGPWGEVPGTSNSNAHLTCRQSYNVLMTDGYWNGSVNSYGNVDNSNGSSITNDIDGSTYSYSPAHPYKDDYSNTLADVAMYYWKRDLQSSLANKVPTNSADPAFWQHLVTYTVGLGVDGSLNATTTAAAIAAATDPGWPNPASGNPQKIDDLWHAAVNSRGEFFSASDPETFAESLSDILISLTSRTTSAASVALNSGALFSGSKLYQARFDTGNWSGQILAFPVNSDGSLSTSSWDAATLIPAYNSRKIATFDGTDGIPFRWDTSVLTSTQQTALGGNADLLNYIRGDASNEAKNGGNFRNRSVLLGDIVHSAPVYIGAPNAPYADFWGSGEPENVVTYSSFRTTHKNRNGVVYVGANDGMLHAFDGETGVELAAYVPNAVISDLSALSDPAYAHRYYVDGSPVIVDTFFNSEWHTVLAGGLRGGGQAIYALDITNAPEAGDTETTLASKVLWEFDDSDDADLGYTFSRPNIVRLHTGVWAAVFGNGYNNTKADSHVSSNGDAVLYVVNLETGALIKKISTQTGMAEDPTSSNRPNGLSTVAPIDVDGDYITDYVYAGDLFGNVWKFDLTSTNTSQWDSAYKSGSNPVPLFTALADQTDSSTAQPITTRLQVARHPVSSEEGYVLFFGTGKYIEVGDSTGSGQNNQTFYAIWDRNNSSLVSFNRDDLLQQKISREVSKTVNGVTTEYRETTNSPINWHTQDTLDQLASSGIISAAQAANASSSTASSLNLDGTANATHLGWYIDLYNTDTTVNPTADNFGERQVSDAILRVGRIIFTTLIPSSSACDFGGDSWSMELDMENGGRLPASPYDLNGDGSFSEDDYFDPDAQVAGDEFIVSGRKSKVGILPTPGILSDFKKHREFQYQSGSTSVIEPVIVNTQQTNEGRQSWIELFK